MTIDDIKSFYTIPATAIPATTAPPTATEENQYSQNITSFVDEVRKNTPTVFTQALHVYMETRKFVILTTLFLSTALRCNFGFNYGFRIDFCYTFWVFK